jgi:hypothetical protein
MGAGNSSVPALTPPCSPLVAIDGSDDPSELRVQSCLAVAHIVVKAEVWCPHSAYADRPC